MPRPAGVTLADLVVLSMLAERPMHGYELWAELERRQVDKWASITKTQVYYSLRKLEAGGHIVSERDGDDSLGPERRVYRPGDDSLGPERRVYRPGDDGRRLLSNELAHAKWATQRPPDPFITWMVLSWQARPRDFNAQIARRKKYVEKQLEEDRAALDAVIAETSPSSDAAMIVRLGIRQFEVELAWLDEVAARQRPG